MDFLIIDELCLLIGFLISYSQRVNPLKTLFDSFPYKMLLIIVLAVGIVVTFFTQTHKNILRRGFVDELKSVALFELWSYILVALVTVYLNDEKEDILSFFRENNAARIEELRSEKQSGVQIK